MFGGILEAPRAGAGLLVGVCMFHHERPTPTGVAEKRAGLVGEGVDICHIAMMIPPYFLPPVSPFFCHFSVILAPG